MHTLERQAEQLQRRRHLAGRARPGPAPRRRRTCPGSSTSRRRRGPTTVGLQPAPYALLVPGGSAAPAGKALAGRALRRAGRAAAAPRACDVVVIGGPQESALAQAIQRKAAGPRPDRPHRFRPDRRPGRARRAGGRQRHRPDAPDRRRRRADPGAVLVGLRPGPLRPARPCDRAAGRRPDEICRSKTVGSPPSPALPDNLQNAALDGVLDRATALGHILRQSRHGFARRALRTSTASGELAYSSSHARAAVQGRSAHQ